MFGAVYFNDAAKDLRSEGVIASHMADLDVGVVDEGQPLTFYIRGKDLCLGTSKTKWKPKCSYRGPAVEPFLYLLLQGTKNQDTLNTAAFMDSEGKRLSTVRALVCTESQGGLGPVRAVAHGNPQAPVKNFERLESIATTAWCIASHENGIEGSNTDTFFSHLCSELMEDEEWSLPIVSPLLSKCLVGGKKNFVMPYMFPPAPHTLGTPWVVPQALQSLDTCRFGQVYRPPNSEEYDIHMLLPANADDDVLRCTFESKYRKEPIHGGIITACIQRMPRGVNLLFIVCDKVAQVPFSKDGGVPDSFKPRNKNPARRAQIYIAKRHGREKVSLSCVRRKTKGIQCDTVVVILALANLRLL